MNILKNIETFIKRTTILDAPFQFAFSAPNRYGLEVAMESLYKHFENFKKWAEKQGAEVTFMRECMFREIIVEVTDPIANIIENL